MADPTTIQWATLAVSGVAAIGATASAMYAVKAQRRNSDRERLRPELERLATELYLLHKRLYALSQRYPLGMHIDPAHLNEAITPSVATLEELHPVLRLYDAELGLSLLQLQVELETWPSRNQYGDVNGELVVKQIFYILNRVRRLLR